MTNIAIIVGHLAHDPETSQSVSGTSMTCIRVITDRPARDKAGQTFKDECGSTARHSESHRIVCFGGLAKTVRRLCAKDQLVSIKGRIGYTTWEDSEGCLRESCEIVADDIRFLTRGRRGGMGEEAESG